MADGEVAFVGGMGMPAMMHAKALVVDSIVSLIGSANFGNRSFELNDELVVAVHDRGLAAAILRDFESDLQQSTTINAATWQDQRSLASKIQEEFWFYFSEIF